MPSSRREWKWPVCSGCTSTPLAGLRNTWRPKVSRPQVHRVMYRLKQERAEQPALALMPVADEDRGAAVAVASVPESGTPESQRESHQLEQSSVEPAALTLTPGQAMPSRYLGLMLFYPAL